MKSPKVFVIILNWNGKHDTKECLESLRKITYPNYTILLVDNGSKDGSVEYFKEAYPKIELIENQKNLGFAEGNNVGIREAMKRGTDYVLLLNNDTIVDPYFLEELIKVSESNPKIGIVGPKMYYYDYKGNKNITWYSGGKILWWFPLHYQSGLRNVKKDSKNDIPKEVDFIPGTCLLIKKDILKYISLPTEYFMQYEDLDFCQQIRKMNFHCVYVPSAKIWHKISASYKKATLKCFQIEMSFKNSIIFYRKYTSKPRFIFILFELLSIKLPIVVIYQLVRTRNMSTFNCALKGIHEALKIIR